MLPLIKRNRTLFFLIIFSFFACLHSILSTKELLVAPLHFGVILGAGSVTFFLLRLITKKRKLYSNALITLLILALLIHPVVQKEALLISTFMTIIAICIKFFGEYKNTPLLNPAVGGILCGSLISYHITDSFFIATWWGSTFFPFSLQGIQLQTSLFFLIAWTVLGINSYQKLPLVLSYLITLFFGVLIFAKDLNFLRFLFFDATIYFFATIILIDPKTSPIQKDQQIYYGSFLAVLSVIFYLQNTWMYAQGNYLICSLAVGNLILFGKKVISDLRR